jgi:hypothetical protein
MINKPATSGFFYCGAQKAMSKWTLREDSKSWACQPSWGRGVARKRYEVTESHPFTMINKTRPSAT